LRLTWSIGNKPLGQEVDLKFDQITTNVSLELSQNNSYIKKTNKLKVLVQICRLVLVPNHVASSQTVRYEKKNPKALRLVLLASGIRTRVRPCLGQRWRRLNAIRGKNPAERLASDARSPNACSAKRGSLNCAEENRRSELRAVFAFKRRAAGARGPKQGLRSLRKRRFS